MTALFINNSMLKTCSWLSLAKTIMDGPPTFVKVIGLWIVASLSPICWNDCMVGNWVGIDCHAALDSITICRSGAQLNPWTAVKGKANAFAKLISSPGQHIAKRKFSLFGSQTASSPSLQPDPELISTRSIGVMNGQINSVDYICKL